MICFQQLIILILGSCYVRSHNILVALSFPGKSHYLATKPLVLGLAARGHNVTLITNYKDENPLEKYTQVIYEKTKTWNVQNDRDVIFEMSKNTFAENFNQLLDSSIVTTENALKSPNIARLLQDNSTRFDLIICNWWFEDAFYMLAHKYQAPLVLFSTYGHCPRMKYSMRIPLELSQTAHLLAKGGPPFTFFQRIENIYMIVYEIILRKFHFMPKQEQLVKKYFENLPQPVPTLDEIQSRASLMLLNAHFSVDRPHNYPPNVVEVGGLQLVNVDTSLPADLSQILDNASEGVVYVSFGTNVKSSKMPKEKVDIFLNVLKGLNQTVLWKWEDSNLENRPDNVYIQDWFPQKGILAHKNTKAFIMHGGLLSFHEAVFFGVPVVVMPFYGDQWKNAMKAQNDEYGKLIKFTDLSVKSLHTALDAVLNDKKYEDNIKQYSLRFRDRPRNALDTAIFWIEYVLRHKGAPYLKTHAIYMPWVSYYMLDIAALAISILIAVFYFLLLVMRFISRVGAFLSKSSPKKANKCKKN